MSSRTLPPLIPPFRFRIVEEGIYCGAYPTIKTFRFLRRLRLKTIISIVPEEPTWDLRKFCAIEGIQNIHFLADKVTDTEPMPVSPKTISEVIAVLLDISCYPVYLHCLDGSAVTGITVMVLRRLQNLDLSAIINEFCRYTHDHSIGREQSDLVRNYSEPILIPLQVPPWLWEGARLPRHPNLRLTHDPPLQPEDQPQAKDRTAQEERKKKSVRDDENGAPWLDLSLGPSYRMKKQIDTQSEEGLGENQSRESVEVSTLLQALALHGLTDIKQTTQ